MFVVRNGNYNFIVDLEDIIIVEEMVSQTIMTKWVAFYKHKVMKILDNDWIAHNVIDF